MGGVRDFLNQDIGVAIDRLLKPYMGFAHSYLLLVYVIEAAIVAAIWIFVSRTLALFVLALCVVSLIIRLAGLLWRGRGS
jgi:hypothetical protein